MRYGKERSTTTLDDNGSTQTEERNIVDYQTVNPIRKYYEYRVKVKDKKEEMTEYLKFTDSLDESKLDPNFKIERSKHGNDNGYYFVVKCYTELEY